MGIAVSGLNFYFYYSWAEKALDVKVTELAFRMSLQQAIGTSLGIAGTGFKMDVLDWNDDTHIGIVKVPQR